MRRLGIDGNNISDINVLRNFSKLEVLYLSGNPITDYGPVTAVYENLEYKDFEINQMPLSFTEAFYRLQHGVTENVCILREDSYDFSDKKFDWLSGGDIYFSDSFSSNNIYANNIPQKGIVDIGTCENAETIQMPASGYTRFGVPAIVGHYYIVIDSDEESSFIIFKLDKIVQESIFITYVCYQEKTIKTYSD